MEISLFFFFFNLLVSIHDAPTNIRVMPAESSANYAGLDSLHAIGRVHVLCVHATNKCCVTRKAVSRNTKEKGFNKTAF